MIFYANIESIALSLWFRANWLSCFCSQVPLCIDGITRINKGRCSLDNSRCTATCLREYRANLQSPQNLTQRHITAPASKCLSTVTDKTWWAAEMGYSTYVLTMPQAITILLRYCAITICAVVHFNPSSLSLPSNWMVFGFIFRIITEAKTAIDHYINHILTWATYQHHHHQRASCMNRIQTELCIWTAAQWVQIVRTNIQTITI